MSGTPSLIRALAACLLAGAVLAGCAHVKPGATDPDRLHNAIAIDDDGYVRDAVKSGGLGVNQRIATPGFREGAPLILIAARYGSVKTLRYLISAGADLNARAATGETALMMAAYFQGDPRDRQEQAVRMLVEAGASLENAPNTYTPLAYAAYQGNDRVVRYLLERGARVDADARDGIAYVNTPLMMAAIQGHLDTALWLLRAGADARTRVYLGLTAAELAQKYNQVHLVGPLRCAEQVPPGESFIRRCVGR